ncbi:hypothetical protein [Flavivirga rizhaonensis]|uniref:hypothetical protein n=1 Tax=Flavivirga rizhaonensis TaxID=2559571 RepID=UPI00269E6906|nr:hypothetical protein [Flavivirga rizhaonensis]
MKNIHCKVFGHDFRVSRNVTYHVKEYTCKNCKKELTTNGSGQLIELTPKFKEINDVLERIHVKRHMRSIDNSQYVTADYDELEPIHITHEVKSSDDQPSTINPANLLVFKH